MPRVLVIDDETEARELLEQILAREGIEVASFHDPWMALDHLVNGELDAVLADVNMPNMDGVEFCERVIGARPDIPVLVFTGAGHVDVVVQAMRAGAFDFLTKPTDPKALLLSL